MEKRNAGFSKKLVYLIICIIAIAYNISPVDLVPDVVPIVGSIDDALITLIPLVMGYLNIRIKERD